LVFGFFAGARLTVTGCAFGCVSTSHQRIPYARAIKHSVVYLTHELLKQATTCVSSSGVDSKTSPGGTAALGKHSVGVCAMVVSQLAFV